MDRAKILSSAKEMKYKNSIRIRRLSYYGRLSALFVNGLLTKLRYQITVYIYTMMILLLVGCKNEKWDEKQGNPDDAKYFVGHG